MSFQYVPSPLTAFEGVRKLPPAHTLVFENDEIRIEPYWTLSFAPDGEPGGHEVAEEVRRLLREAVEARLMSDVPLGAFLSGGIDSSSIVALMSEFGRVKTFSVGFEEEGFSELPHARLVADRYATDHREFVVRADAAEILPKLVEHYGEPFADSSALPTYYLAKLTAEHVKVALNGDGGDEVFGGYDRYRLMPLFSALASLPGATRLARGLSRSVGSAFPPKIARLLDAVSPTPEEAYTRVMSYFSDEQKRGIYSPEMVAQVASSDSHALLLDRFETCAAEDLVGRTLGVDDSSYLPGDLLVKVDIATMASGLEGRSPFLDHPLVEFVARLPTAQKVGLSGGKRILRRAVADLLPSAILKRRKQGFGVPISRWFRGELGPLLRDNLLTTGARSLAFLRKDAIERLIKEHDSGARDHGNRLWALLMLELWQRRFLS